MGGEGSDGGRKLRAEGKIEGEGGEVRGGRGFVG